MKLRNLTKITLSDFFTKKKKITSQQNKYTFYINSIKIQIFSLK